jgi:predicted lactoylglutathione lyase
MPRLIFVNLPVSELARSTAFYQALGFTLNPQFSDDTASCMVLSDVIHVMLLTHDKFKMFTPRDIADGHRVSQVLLCISADSREDVDRIMAAALAHGGAEPRGPQDHGFMYGRSFEDPDGHIWEPMWMDMSALGDRPAGEVVAEQTA